MYKFNKKHIIYLSLALNLSVLIGCTQSVPGLNDTSAQNSSQTISTLKFSKVSSDKSSEINNIISRGISAPSGSQVTTSQEYSSSEPMAMPTSMPSASASANPYASTPPYPGTDSDYYTSPVPTPTAYPYSPGYEPDIVYASPVPGYYGAYYGSYSPFEDYIISDVEEAKEKGMSGSYLDIYNSVIKPILPGLASDIKLISAYGNADSSGKITNNTPEPAPSAGYYGYYNQFQWQFTYISNQNKEVYSILISPTETIVYKQIWRKKEISSQDIKIDSTKAIELVKEIISDRSKPANSPQPYGDNSQELYSIPDKASINYSLEQSKTDLIWYINYNLYITEEPNTYYSSGYAQVNAGTGEVLSFSRIVKYTYQTYTSPSPTPYSAEPFPYETPLPVPTEKP